MHFRDVVKSHDGNLKSSSSKSESKSSDSEIVKSKSIDRKSKSTGLKSKSQKRDSSRTRVQVLDSSTTSLVHLELSVRKYFFSNRFGISGGKRWMKIVAALRLSTDTFKDNIRLSIEVFAFV